MREQQQHLPHIELVAVALAILHAVWWARSREPIKTPEFAALAIIVTAFLGLLFLRGDIVTRQLWLTNGKVWAWMMLLIGGKLAASLQRSKRS